MDKGKWIVRGASLAILMGFFMPAVLVSCSGGFVDASQSFSLANIADQANQSILYLLPIAAVAAGVLTIIRARSVSQQVAYHWGQLGAIGVGLLTMIGSLLSLNDQLSRGTYGLFKVTPAIGTFIIIGGVIAFGIGWFQQKQALESLTGEADFIPRPGIYEPPEEQAYLRERPPNIQEVERVQASGAHLELVTGDLPVRIIPLPTDNFAIGRGSDSDLQLPDRAVSRTHALIRQAQGMWFLQDQESSGGTFVNGIRTPATRLQDGDEIEIGPFRFVFHMRE